ncbi:Rtr1/RPAP2 family-domain-containing protein [Stachybotrys elegans]|uniref:RNA polymerase II subunit B1 CTD phosphatase RPAP2 homolog n=1 Tax=Stachybotrys elegans TaxID=80388 RepID=A0A8K0STN4_9HYPO|nr:Rtr1/RPAP2 family-domain-containing protein [Stachybotrys elegans]
MASGSAQPPKGILKTRPSPASQMFSRGLDPRQVAIQHAQILQHRKDLEAQILDSLILLSEYPMQRSPSFSAADPAASDVADFKHHVRLFQPSDYDDLIIERNVNELCGYTLCPNARRQTGPGGEWKIMPNGNIVRRKDVEMWCSNMCAKRALYVKVQLNETAAWERAGIPDIEIDLFEETRPSESEADCAVRQLEKLRLEDERQAALDSAALALERGDSVTGLSRNMANITLKEKDVAPPQGGNVAFTEDQDGHLLVEGYKSRQGAAPKQS